MSTTVKQALLSAELNVFGADILLESFLKSGQVESFASPNKSLNFFYSIDRPDCAKWSGVEVTLKPVRKNDNQPIKPLLTGNWHHGNGVLACGTVRIATQDFDSNPPEEIKTQIFDWICQSLNADISNESTKNLPRDLTAKNGAKALLIGEFYEEIHFDCYDCNGEGVTQIGSPEQCETCNGTGQITQRVDVQWTTIKAIYQKIVEHYTK